MSEEALKTILTILQREFPSLAGPITVGAFGPSDEEGRTTHTFDAGEEDGRYCTRLQNMVVTLEVGDGDNAVPGYLSGQEITVILRSMV